jgi:vanillate/4-hydroxybenzoate decarboxylase subunit D
MTTSSADSLPTTCPRCRSGPIQVLGKSPVAGVWTVFGCSTCLYAWRSTEPEENVNPDKYPAAFRLPRRILRSSEWSRPFRHDDHRHR